MRWKARGQRACFTLPSVEKAYRFYRFLLHENVNQLPDNYYSLADIELYSLYLPALTDADLTYSLMMITFYYGILINYKSDANCYASYSSFDSLVNAFEYYNCDSERGTYSAFYVEVM